MHTIKGTKLVSRVFISFVLSVPTNYNYILARCLCIAYLAQKHPDILMNIHISYSGTHFMRGHRYKLHLLYLYSSIQSLHIGQ